MSVVAISTPFNISIDLATAPVWKRIIAILLDDVILFIYIWAIRLLVIWTIDDETISFTLSVFLGLPVLLYHFLMETFFSGQSIGKKAMGIRVVNFNGNEGTVSQYFLRMLFRSEILAPLAALVVVSLFSSIEDNETILYVMSVIVTLIAGFSMFLYFIISKYGQRIGDKLANTLVIETHAAADIHQTIFLDVTDQAYQVKYPEVMRLTDRDINGIRNLLDVKRITSESEAYMSRIATRIERVLNVKTEQEPYEFLAQLLRDYNFLTSK